MKEGKSRRSIPARLVLLMICLGTAGSILATGVAAQDPVSRTPDDEWRCNERCTRDFFNEMNWCPHVVHGDAVSNFFEKIACWAEAIAENHRCAYRCHHAAGP